MTIKKIAKLMLIVSIALPLVLGCGHDHDDDDDFDGEVAILKITHFDADQNGVPDTYMFQVQFVGDANDNYAADPPRANLPDGSQLLMSCAVGEIETSCQTGYQVPPGAGDITDILTGAYQIAISGGVIYQFDVDPLELADPDPASADLATLAPPPPGPLADPAVLDWDPTAATAGLYWRYAILNNDGDDDQGQTSFEPVVKWEESNFSQNLPDTWDSGDALLVRIVSINHIDYGDYSMAREVEVIIAGYTLL